MNPFQEKLEQFVQDEAMFNAVKGVFLSSCDLNTIKVTTPNVELGEITLGWLQARELIQQGFKELEKYRRKEARTETGENVV